MWQKEECGQQDVRGPTTARGVPRRQEALGAGLAATRIAPPAHESLGPARVSWRRQARVIPAAARLVMPPGMICGLARGGRRPMSTSQLAVRRHVATRLLQPRSTSAAVRSARPRSDADRGNSMATQAAFRRAGRT